MADALPVVETFGWSLRLFGERLRLLVRLAWPPLVWALAYAYLFSTTGLDLSGLKPGSVGASSLALAQVLLPFVFLVLAVPAAVAWHRVVQGEVTAEEAAPAVGAVERAYLWLLVRAVLIFAVAYAILQPSLSFVLVKLLAFLLPPSAAAWLLGLVLVQTASLAVAAFTALWMAAPWLLRLPLTASGAGEEGYAGLRLMRGWRDKVAVIACLMLLLNAMPSLAATILGWGPRFLPATLLSALVQWASFFMLLAALSRAARLMDESAGDAVPAGGVAANAAAG